MPNLKIYVDATLTDAANALSASLTDLRAVLCHAVGTDPAHCQMAVMRVDGLPDQPGVNVELSILLRPGRDGDMLKAVAAQIQAFVTDRTNLQAAVRISLQDPQYYVVAR